MKNNSCLHYESPKTKNTEVVYKGTKKVKIAVESVLLVRWVLNKEEDKDADESCKHCLLNMRKRENKFEFAPF